MCRWFDSAPGHQDQENASLCAGVFVFKTGSLTPDPFSQSQPLLLLFNAKDRYLLARIACHLEDVFSLTNRVGFTTYWQRDLGMKTFDIEHLLKVPFDTAALPTAHGFSDAKDYNESRNLFGALVLLPRSRNRSLQDKAYRDKLAAYATENVLAQTLCDALYQNNPNIATYVQANTNIGLAAISDFSKANIAHRANVYIAVAQKVWQMP